MISVENVIYLYSWGGRMKMEMEQSASGLFYQYVTVVLRGTGTSSGSQQWRSDQSNRQSIHGMEIMFCLLVHCIHGSGVATTYLDYWSFLIGLVWASPTERQNEYSNVKKYPAFFSSFLHFSYLLREESFLYFLVEIAKTNDCLSTIIFIAIFFF